MKMDTSGTNHVDSRSQPVQRPVFEARSVVNSRALDKGRARSQRRKQRGNRHRTQEQQCGRNQEPEQPNKKRLKTKNDPNGTRRHRNLKNLMMIERLETNIGRMEARLQGLGFDLCNEETTQASPQQLVSNSLHSTPSPYASDPGNFLDQASFRGEPHPQGICGNLEESHAAAIPELAQEGDVLVTHEVKEDLFPDFGCLVLPRCILDTPAARSLPALSHEGLEWVSQQSGVTPGLFPGRHINTMSFGPLGPLGSLCDDFPRKTFCPLPSRGEASSLLHEYLQNFNSMCPLFEQAKLVSLFNQDNLEASLRSPALWASANVVFALGITFRINDGVVLQSEYQRSWLFIKNAFGTFHHLCLGQPDMWSIQALLGMSVFFLGTMSAEPCCFLVTAAIRMIHQIGLGKGEESVTLDSEYKDHRRIIFWIAYCLDREVSLRFGRPPTQSDDDMSIDLPTDTPIGNASIIPSMYQRVEFDAFRAHCQLATIKGQVYKDLYSAAAKNRSLSELITSVGALDQMLENWKEELPSKYQPESQRLQSISMTLLYLHCSYFNCIIAMHRLIASRGIRTGDDLVRKYQNFSFSASLSGSRRVFSSESLCTNAARASIRLMKYIPEGHISAVGILIHYPIVALSTLSSSIIQNPVDASRLSDMGLIDQVETLLSSLVASIPNQAIAQLKTYCANYRAAAKAAIQKTMQFCANKDPIN
ncbi:fungal specific transcription factor domain-containing protein [Aspergillus puulaauensis]|uniref:Xylanolytic transcriptional activator regulatory domain-containing protein n=1 Tax=Aspergillus puulaauensis TaxID=1220207 RepID=A0A7R7XKG5_9EURO|nr:uncharacterized protein APUU_31149A [Aspergillus puulaauensis]BCS22924.1 hypothetical protein APUU_31149A [Aspergillus puulaauensis]